MRLTLSAIVEASSKWDVNRFRPDALRRQLTPGDLLSRRCLELASLEAIEQLFCCREIDVFPQTGSADLTAWVTNFFFATLNVLSSPRGDACESTKVENGTFLGHACYLYQACGGVHCQNLHNYLIFFLAPSVPYFDSKRINV